MKVWIMSHYIKLQEKGDSGYITLLIFFEENDAISLLRLG